MRIPWKRIALFTTLLIGVLVIVFALALFVLAKKEKPTAITYGMSFNTMYAEELGLDPNETYDAILDDLGVRHLRLAAHWPMVEPTSGNYNFKELDYQVRRAEEVGAEVVMAVGRRLPRWPECHIPQWADELTREERDSAQLRYMEAVINRYKNSPAITVWQVENEPFLEVFAFEHCGELDTALLEREIAHVRSLDGTRPILVTDSGNLGTWQGAYKHGDMFGTSVYVHFWNPELGQFRTFLPPWFYRVKDNLMGHLYGEKPTLLIELSAEPWLIEPVVDVPLEVQFTRMNLEKFEDIITYAEGTHFEKQYLWGAEWWYWLKKQDRHEMWDRGKRLYVKESE
ncbi:MAG TPA: beta-galactosidase [Candidatus Paceibacterota bacterium]